MYVPDGLFSEGVPILVEQLRLSYTGFYPRPLLRGNEGWFPSVRPRHEGLSIGRLRYGLATCPTGLPILTTRGGSGVGSVHTGTMSRFRVELGV